MIRQSHQHGFSAVELLIALFVAAAFLMTGYQLYSVVIRDSGEIQQQATASNVAYNYLRQANPPATCVASTPTNNVVSTHEKLGSIRVTVTISCPQSSLPSLSKVQATVQYAKGYSKEVAHAVFVNK